MSKSVSEDFRIYNRINEVLNEFESKCCRGCFLYGQKYKSEFCFYATDKKRREEVIEFLIVNKEISYDEYNQMCLSDEYG